MGVLPVDNALIDGEAVVFRPDGHSDFAALRTRAGGEQASLVAFDLLSLEGEDLRERPLEERREALARLSRWRRRPVQRGWRPRARRVRQGVRVGLEGIVSKRLGSRYRSGASRNWLKCLNPAFQRG